MYFQFKFFLYITLFVSPVFGGWDDWIWGEDEETLEVETTTKRFDENGLCDHDPLTNIILKFLLETKSQMKRGNLSAGRPPMDPLNIPEMKQNLVSTDPNIYYNIIAHLSEVSIDGLSDFNITHISSSVLEMGANISLIMGQVTISAKFQFKGFGKFGFVKLPIYAHGKVSIMAKSVDAGANLSVAFSDEGNLIIQEFDYYMIIEDIAFQFKRLNGDLIRERWNNLLNNIGVKLFRKMEPRIQERIKSRGITGINTSLKKRKYNRGMWQHVIADTINCYFG